MEETRHHIIQEQVPGKQITLAHIIANPDPMLLEQIGLAAVKDRARSAIGVLTVTPAETAIIYADIAIKASGVSLGHVDCQENGSLLLNGTVSEVEASVRAILAYATETLGCEVCGISRT